MSNTFCLLYAGMLLTLYSKSSQYFLKSFKDNVSYALLKSPLTTSPVPSVVIVLVLSPLACVTVPDTLRACKFALDSTKCPKCSTIEPDIARAFKRSNIVVKISSLATSSHVKSLSMMLLIATCSFCSNASADCIDADETSRALSTSSSVIVGS